MKTIVLVLFACVSLSGCFHHATREVVRTVEVPVPYCPPPPVISPYSYQVDALTPQDVTDPGKVGQAYKADMTYLRDMEEIYKMILQQYKSTSTNFDEVTKRLRELATKITTPAQPTDK